MKFNLVCCGSLHVVMYTIMTLYAQKSRQTTITTYVLCLHSVQTHIHVPIILITIMETNKAPVSFHVVDIDMVLLLLLKLSSLLLYVTYSFKL